MRTTTRIFILILSLGLTQTILGQIREYRIHDRGMLHNTVFNTGEIGRAWQTGDAGNYTSVPLFEWPPYSKTVVGGIEYDGQHNILGAGVYIGANLEGSPGETNRLFALCGAVGASSPEVAIGRWSFPLYMEEIENFPLNADGHLNEDYNPNEAEEIITAAWASSTGITVTRTSRQWSYPDYDDFIIYEYEFEYTGDTDGNPATIEMTDDLKDVMIAVNYGFAPSMYGYQRQYLEWKYSGGLYRGDQNNFWDSDWWLSFNMNLRVNISDASLPAKPEPDPERFMELAQSGINGGALGSPQAPGYAILFYDTTHLAYVVPESLDSLGLNDSETQAALRTSTLLSLDDYDQVDIYRENDDGSFTWYYELDEKHHIKQPWSNKVSTGNTNSPKMMYEKDAFNPNTRWSGVYSPNSVTWAERKGDHWLGRAAYPYRQSADAGMKLIVFGPYSLKIGDKLELSYAEVVGYGAEPDKRIEGGNVTQQWMRTPDWNRRYVIDGQVMTEAYLDDFGYPDYVNSTTVRTVTEVTEKAFEAYMGQTPTVPVWPEANGKDGSYQIPPPFPAPILTIKNNELATVKLTWYPDQEDFVHPLLSSTLERYYIWRSVAGMGPWTLLDSLEVGTPMNIDGKYEYIDVEENFKVGEYRYYAVTSVSDAGQQSGKTNIGRFGKNIAAVEELTDVYVVPNPYRADIGSFHGLDAGKIGFYGLPEVCTIQIYSYAMQLVRTIEHAEPAYSNLNHQTTRVGQEMASGIYFYVVTTPEGDSSNGKFVIIK
ncbi:MAG: hypothetical protein U9Q77_13430 [Candidatus Marinimicrobia bacterium]|nr:hypothetical protein [Candidatus Neomarinimicrobiota bacterium]